MTALSHARYRAEVTRQFDLLRATLDGADLSVTVPTCPDWTLGQLARHMGGAVRWSGHLIETRAEKNVPDEAVPNATGPGDDDPAALDAWLADTAEFAERVFRDTDADTAVWAWAEDHTAGFWARRMTHELAIHRADAAIAAGVAYEVAPDVAADAIDEWLEIVQFVQRASPEDSASELKGAGRSIHLHATDAPEGLDAEWLIEFGEDGFTWRRGHAKASVALRGPLTEVLLAFYRRRPIDSGLVEVVGERELLEFWLERATFG